MKFRPYYDGTKDPQGRVRGWRVMADYSEDGGQVVDLFGAVDERTAWETAESMNGNLRR